MSVPSAGFEGRLVRHNDATVGNVSEFAAHSSQMCPAGIVPVHLAKNGTLHPPSKVVPFRPLRIPGPHAP